MTTQNEPPFPLFLILILFTALFFIISSFTLTSIASPYIVGDLGGDRTITTYALSFFGFGTAMSIPLAKPLGAKFGETHIFVICILLFGICNLLCALAPTYFCFVVARLIAGFVSGPFYPLLAHFFSVFVPSNKITFIRWIFVTMLVVVPVIGACWGGTIAYLSHWNFPFFLNAAFALPLSLIAYFAFKGKENKLIKGTIDWIGWAFYATGIFCLTFAITTAQQLDWYRSPLFIAATLLGLITFGYYLVRSFTHESPPLDLKLLRKPIFTLALLTLVTLFSVYFGIIILLSIWLKLDVQFTPVWISILMGHMVIAGLLPRFIIEEKFGRIDPRIWLITATALLAASCFYTTTFNSEINLERIALSRIVAGFGLALFLPPIFQILSQSFAPSKWIEVFELFQCIRNLACGIGAAVFSIIWERRSVFYHERLNETLSVQSPQVQTFFNKFETLHVPGSPLVYLNDFLNRRAASLALDDVFYLMGWILFALGIVLICTFFFKKDAFALAKSKYSEEIHKNSL